MPTLGQCLLRIDHKVRELSSYSQEKYSKLVQEVNNFTELAGMIQDGQVMKRKLVADYSLNLGTELGTVLSKMPVKTETVDEY